ncbi:MAG: 2-iminoacetate synthase ThiH [Verrucomicrobiota bacterium]|nr:2-iminoacetate synthase ThiH [Verrucomicrobiota bacterium]
MSASPSFPAASGPATGPAVRPDWADPGPWLDASAIPERDDDDVGRLVRLLRDDPPAALERMAGEAERLTRCRFGRVIQLYAPLYLSNYCSSGCAYCGYAADRRQNRLRLEPDEIEAELEAMQRMGIDDALLLTGERCPEAGMDYLADAVARAARRFDHVGIESFAMSADEYQRLADAGCASLTIYQETYDPALYQDLHRWGPKRDYLFRLEAPDRALAAGMRAVGIGALLGLGDPIADVVALYRHARHLQRRHWRGGVAVSFPRVRPEPGYWQPRRPVGDALLARVIFAFRLCLPDTPLALSTREQAAFRDGMAGIGINRMSVASRTTVGGYRRAVEGDGGQFAVRDTRDVDAFCRMLRRKGLEPVFKNWAAIFNE